MEISEAGASHTYIYAFINMLTNAMVWFVVGQSKFVPNAGPHYWFRLEAIIPLCYTTTVVTFTRVYLG